MTNSGAFPIGGFFELELPTAETIPHKNALKYQSARAAFYALLMAGKPKRVWIPGYICDVMLSPLIEMNIDWQLYDLNDDLEIAQDINLEKNDWLLYINYFGVCEEKIDDLLQRYPRQQIVLDYSHAFFAQSREVLATIYSPRKFFGIPDGGLLITEMAVSVPAELDRGSRARMPHLISRLDNDLEQGYKEYGDAEKSLSDCLPKHMSRLTENLLSSIDFNEVSQLRQLNYEYLHQRLGTKNLVTQPILQNQCTPLCYPFYSDKAGMREWLCTNKIFVPTYWKDAYTRVNESWGQRMITQFFPLPIDQRYSQKDMERVVSVVERGLQ